MGIWAFLGGGGVGRYFPTYQQHLPSRDKHFIWLMSRDTLPVSAVYSQSPLILQ